jgi:hypothetical protein
MRCVRNPKPEIAHASTPDITLFLEALECEVHRPLRAAYTPYQVAGMELLAGGSGQEREQADLRRTTAKTGRAA